ncbi:MAG: hypothetical protein RLZZ04_239 [Cyanobacteriota bacterium]
MLYWQAPTILNPPLSTGLKDTEASQELDPEKRQRLFIKMNDILVEDVAVIPLVHRADVMAFSNSLTGYEPTAWDVRTWDIMNWRRKGNE